MSLVAIFLFSLLILLPLQNECGNHEKPEPKPKPNHESLNVEERKALEVLFDDVPNDTTWNTSEPACSWKGVTCDPTNQSVVYLKLPGKSLIGNIPMNTIGRLTNLRVLSLRFNRLSGVLPLDFSNLTSLTHLSLNNNNFSGTIPSGFSNFPDLIRLDLNDNNFTGQLPCINAKKLRRFNVSFNKLNSSIPRSLSKFPKNLFSKNDFLCGAPSKNVCITSYTPVCPIDHKPLKNPKKTPEIIGISVGSGLLVLIIVCFVRKRIHQQTKQPPKPILYKERNNIVELDESIYRLDLDDLLNASAVVLGEGSVGRSYKQVLEGKNTTVVVKRLIIDVMVTANEFRTTMESLGKMKNENVVPLRAYYYSKHEKWLVYDYMPDGSLYDRLHGNAASGQTHIDWDHRMRIALSAARGLKYLHEAGIVHGNIKSSNILLRSQETNNEASLSDYGLNNLFDESSSIEYQVITGYWAPEDPKDRKVTFQSDVYSFGVLLLELLTGQNPKQDSFSKLVQSVLSEELEAGVFDLKLRRENNIKEMKQLLQIAKNCVSKDRDQQRTMEEVVRMMVEMWPRVSSCDHSKGYDDTPSTDTRDTPSTSTFTP